MKTMRNNTISGIYETKTLDTAIHLHFSEWWSGDGADFNFDDKSISLSIDELEALVSCAFAMGMIDLDEVKREGTAIVNDGERRATAIKNMTKDTNFWCD